MSMNLGKAKAQGLVCLAVSDFKIVEELVLGAQRPENIKRLTRGLLPGITLGNGFGHGFACNILQRGCYTGRRHSS